MKTGPKFLTLLNVEGYKTELPKETIVSIESSVRFTLLGSDRQAGKKLKKRLEDLERRAGSSSSSPEQKHEELPEHDSASEDQSTHPVQRQRSSGSQVRRDRTPDILPQQYVLPSEDRGMFSHQFTRQLSTSPPPFSYGSLSAVENATYSNYPQNASYCSLPGNGMDMQLYPQYLPPIQQNYHHVPSITTPPIKQEYYDDDMNPFSMSYATMAGIDVSAAQSYQVSSPAYVSNMPRRPQLPRSYSQLPWPPNAG